MSTYMETYVVPRTGQQPLRFKGAKLAEHRVDTGLRGRVWLRLLRNSRRQFVCAASRIPVVIGDRGSDEAAVVSDTLGVVKFFGGGQGALAVYRAAKWHGLADFLAGLPGNLDDEEVVEHVALWLHRDTPEAAQ